MSSPRVATYLCKVVDEFTPEALATAAAPSSPADGTTVTGTIAETGHDQTTCGWTIGPNSPLQCPIGAAAATAIRPFVEPGHWDGTAKASRATVFSAMSFYR